MILLKGVLRAFWLCAILSFPLISQAPAAADLQKALALFNSGAYQACYQSLSSYTKEHPDSGSAFKVLGMTEFMLGQPDKAREHLTRATTLTPHDADAFYYLGRLYFTADNPVTAALEFQKALAIDPSNVRAENQLGQSLEALGRLQEAETAYQKAIEFEQNQAKKSEWPCYNLALLYLHNGRGNESIEYFRRALTYNPKFVDGKIKLAVALTAEKKDDEAERLLREAIGAQETNSEAHYRLAIVLKRSGKQEDANREFALFEKYQKR